MMKNKKELAALLFDEMTKLLDSKGITKDDYLPMLADERQKKGIPLSYRAYRYLNEGKLLLRANKLAKVAAALNIEIQPETIYFIKKIQ